ncbi:helix-turn-helix domain-containing protein [Haloechinothrix sp. LS1_15]|uniref:helix-turn-helix domain-containing protein n=1 Tax=Haloechinothrix sp. LS1_15 TaxID=2652248 RepID=UPI0029442D49|nr:helix-turn-helix domain-containing protein [Haloechinothrix sp. LS1_15]MDV6013393.1 helix-turn-helix transcriptional regulator [Haloechinothrix sp. LS1_15]
MSAGELATLADRINHLFTTVHPAGRGPYSNDEVASAITEHGATSISATYIWMLRKGYRDNPTMKHLDALASFFGVPVAYFFDDTTAAEVAAELETLTALKNAGVHHVALRAAGLSERSLNSIVDVINRVRELEGLPRQEESTQ